MVVRKWCCICKQRILRLSWISKKGVQMPTYLQIGQRQHTTQEANLLWLVSKVRWIDERVIGQIKQRKLLNKFILNTIIPHIEDLIKIACALCKPEKVAHKMFEEVNASNRLHQIVEEINLLRKKVTYMYQSIGWFSKTSSRWSSWHQTWIIPN